MTWVIWAIPPQKRKPPKKCVTSVCFFVFVFLVPVYVGMWKASDLNAVVPIALGHTVRYTQ